MSSFTDEQLLQILNDVLYNIKMDNTKWAIAKLELVIASLEPEEEKES